MPLNLPNGRMTPLVAAECVKIVRPRWSTHIITDDCRSTNTSRLCAAKPILRCAYTTGIPPERVRAAATFFEPEKSYRKIIGHDQLWILKPHLDDLEPVAGNEEGRLIKESLGAAIFN